MKGNYAVLVQSLEKQAEVGVKELKKNYESANKKRYYRNMYYFTDSRIFWTYNALNDLFFNYLSFRLSANYAWAQRDIEKFLHTFPYMG